MESSDPFSFFVVWEGDAKINRWSGRGPKKSTKKTSEGGRRYQKNHDRWDENKLGTETTNCDIRSRDVKPHCFLNNRQGRRSHQNVYYSKGHEGKFTRLRWRVRRCIAAVFKPMKFTEWNRREKKTTSLIIILCMCAKVLSNGFGTYGKRSTLQTCWDLCFQWPTFFVWMCVALSTPLISINIKSLNVNWSATLKDICMAWHDRGVISPLSQNPLY